VQLGQGWIRASSWTALGVKAWATHYAFHYGGQGQAAKRADKAMVYKEMWTTSITVRRKVRGLRHSGRRVHHRTVGQRGVQCHGRGKAYWSTKYNTRCQVLYSMYAAGQLLRLVDFHLDIMMSILKFP